MIWTKLQIYLCLGSVLLSFASGCYVRGKFYEAAEIKDLKISIESYKEKEKAAQVKSLSLETELARQRMENLRLNQELLDEIKKPEYSAVLPTRSLQLINDAVRPPIPR